MDKISFSIEIKIPAAEKNGINFNSKLPDGVIGSLVIDFDKDKYEADPIRCNDMMVRRAEEFRDEIIKIEYKKL